MIDSQQMRVEHTLRAIHDLTASTHLGFDDQVRGVLEIGSRQLGMPVSAVTRLDGDRLVLPYVVGGSDAMPEGMAVQVCDSFCGEAIRLDSRLAIHDAKISGFADHPGHVMLGLQAYLGQPIYVDGAVWGTVCFMGAQSRDQPFAETDFELFELICQWIQLSIEHDAVLQGFRSVVSGTSRGTGQGFFRSLAAELGRSLKADLAFVAECIDAGCEGGRVKTLAVWNGEELTENFEYDSKHTPCEQLTPDSVTYYPDGIQERFPSDPGLAQRGMHGFAGIAITDQAGVDLGHLVALTKRPLRLKRHERWLIEIFAARAGAELERLRADGEQRRLEREVLHSEKLKSLGVLAGGIAHDFNNLLTGIVGNAGLIQMNAPEGSDLAERVTQIERAALQAGNLTKQMLAYSGRGAFVVEPVDLNATFREVSELLDSAVSKTAELQRSFTKNPLVVEADATQVRQILMNLIMNASDALQGNPGKVCLRTGIVDLSTSDLRDYVFGDQMAPGNYAYIEVEDSGIGMGANTKLQMFDPFFTTKPAGSGLGLSAALGIVRSHGGAIHVRSEIELGTCVRVLFPATPSISANEPRGSDSQRQSRITGTALVVDDEEVVLNVSSEILRRCGMRVVTARDGVEAVETFQEHRSEIVVVLLDLTMPRMDGRSAAKKMRSIDPTVPVILMSGFHEAEAKRKFADSCFDSFVQKPFTATSLVDAVRCLALSPQERTDAPND